MRGLDRLQASGVKLRFKAMALRSNAHEMPAIARFCQERTKDYFRYDPMLHLRFDGDPTRNEEIRSERLSPEEIVALERADADRFQALQKGCDRMILGERSSYKECLDCADQDDCESFAALTRLFGCGAGRNSFSVGYDGTFRLCSSLWHPDCVHPLRTGHLRDAWEDLVPRVRAMRTRNEALLRSCGVCPYVNLCLWCPAHAHLETGDLEGATPYLCDVAHARAQALQGAAQPPVQSHPPDECPESQRQAASQPDDALI
jgi:radical SAM protein with 4Fe4S-binding SPASM domain